jgi:hypothetical protein
LKVVLKETYLRFETLSPHPDSGKASGVFSILHEIRDDDRLTDYDLDRLNALMTWFAKNLKKPDSFTSSKSKGAARRATRGLSYFKSSAGKHISKIRELNAIVREYGYEVIQFSTTRPGIVVYEDEFQIVAEPFSSRD